MTKTNLELRDPAHLQREWCGLTTKGVEWRVYQGDAKITLTELESNSFNCVVTSPPYYSLRDYGVNGQIGLEDSVTEYVSAIADVMKEVFRVLTDDGLLFLNIGDTYYSGKGKSHGVDPKSNKRRFGLRPVDKSGGVGIGIRPKSAIGIPWRVALAMMTDQWILRSPIIWHRQSSLPEAVKDRPRRGYEYVLMFAKQRNYYFNRDALKAAEVHDDVWTITNRPKASAGLDTAPFPDELVRRCLDLGCPSNGMVLDPFAGSGTTVRVAVSNGRSGVGIDLSPTFCSYMVQQLSSL